MAKIEIDKSLRYSVNIEVYQVKKEILIFGLESATGEKSNFRSAQQLSSYE